MHNTPNYDCGLPIVTEDLLILFVSHCAARLHISHTTIKLYLCGIRHSYIERMGLNPFLNNTGEQYLRLQTIMRGIKKSHPTTTKTRLPITSSLLAKICQTLRNNIFGTYEDLLMEACCVMAFFGFLRCGEFTYPSQTSDAQDGLCLGDISFMRDTEQAAYVSLHLKHSKTDPFRIGHSIMLYATDSFLCPVTSLRQYLNHRCSLSRDPDMPLFLFPDRSLLTRSSFLKMLHIVLSRIGTPTQGHTGHSFRTGAGTQAAAVHIPDHLIKTMGRWSSDCYQLYIKTPSKLIKEAQRKLAQVQ